MSDQIVEPIPIGVPGKLVVKKEGFYFERNEGFIFIKENRRV